MHNKDIDIIFFGTPEFAVITLEELKKKGFLPTLIVTAEDKPVGRKLIITPPPVKLWAQAHNIPFIQPRTLKTEDALLEIQSYLAKPTLGIVASYGKILPKAVLDTANLGMLNVHPSLLPKLRGPSPVQSAILTENETGVSIMLLDEEMDHGPILAQKKVDVEWPPYIDVLEPLLAHKGGELLSAVIPQWLAKQITPVTQAHEQATYCKKITKADGEIHLSDAPEHNLRKIRAFRGWPYAYFFTVRNNTRIRVLVTEAHIENDQLVITKVIPEGKKEMSFADFERGLSKSLK